jgi:hypothetical protein
MAKACNQRQAHRASRSPLPLGGIMRRQGWVIALAIRAFSAVIDSGIRQAKMAKDPWGCMVASVVFARVVSRFRFPLLSRSSAATSRLRSTRA